MASSMKRARRARRRLMRRLRRKRRPRPRFECSFFGIDRSIDMHSRLERCLTRAQAMDFTNAELARLIDDCFAT